MFETFKEEYIRLEKYYDEKSYDKVVREGGKIVEGLVAYIFRTFPTTLKSQHQKEIYIEFEKSFQKDKSNRFLDFISKPTIGVSIGYYTKLCQKFAAEEHPWLKGNIKSSLDIANSIRNKFAHSGNHKPSDDDASDLLDAFEIVIEELNLQKETPKSIGLPLSLYLIYSSIMYNFDNVANKEQDWKGIIADSKKIIPQLLTSFFYQKYYQLPLDDKYGLGSEIESLSAENNETDQREIYEGIFEKLSLSVLVNSNDNVDLAVRKFLSNKKEKFDRRGVKPYTKLLSIIVEELKNPDYDDYLKYAVMVKNKYLHDNEIDDKERIELLSFANSLNISSKTAYKIESEVIYVINNELTLYQTLQCPTGENEDSEKTSPAESILIEMIKKGTPEDIVISVANSQNFAGDVYKLLTRYGKANSVNHQKKKSRKVESENKGNSDVIYGKALAAYKRNDYSESIKLFTDLIAIDPTNYDAYDYRGTCYYNNNEFSKAALDYSESLKLNPENSTTVYNRGNCYFSLKQYDLAIKDYTEKIKLSPSGEMAYSFRGLCYFYLNDHENGFNDLSHAIALNKYNHRCFNNRGNSYYALKEYEKAIADFSESIKLHPVNSLAFINRAHCYFCIKNYEKAAQDYTETIKLNPQSESAYSYRGHSYKHLERFEEALADFEMVLKLNPNNTNIKQHKDFIEQKLMENKNNTPQNQNSTSSTSTTYSTSSGSSVGSSEEFSDEKMQEIFNKYFDASKKDLEKSTYAGSHLKVKIPLTLEEIYSGVQKKIKVIKFNQCSDCGGSGIKEIEMESKCPACNGTGKTTKINKTLFGDAKETVECKNCDGFGYIDVVKCPNCEGEGRVKEETTISIDVPAGVVVGQVIELKGYGNAGRRGGATGILYCEFEEIEHEHFSREDLDIFYDVEIKQKKADKGTNVVIPTLDGKVKMTIPAGSENGKMLKITGKGLPLINSGKKGDMFVRINVID